MLHLNTVESIAAILLALFGTGGIGHGGWRVAAAIVRRAQAIEQFREQTRTTLAASAEAIQLLTGLTASHQARLDAHDELHARTEHPWTTPTANTAGAATPPDHGLPPPVHTPTR